MKTIELTQDKVALVDDEAFEFLSQWKWTAKRSFKTWYARRTIWVPGGKGKQRNQFMHSLLFPEIPQLDHRDRNGLNNQKENLRPATTSLNNANRDKRSNTSSRFRGVSWDPSRKLWKSRIKFHGKELFLGRFQNEEEAAKAYDAMATEAFGEFANFNFTRLDEVCSLKDCRCQQADPQSKISDSACSSDAHRRSVEPQTQAAASVPGQTEADLPVVPPQP